MSLIKQVSVLLAAALSTVGCIPKTPRSRFWRRRLTRTVPATAMIEDGEDDNNQVIVQEGRSGYVYTFGDKAGSTIAPGEGAFTMAAAGANGSKHSMHVNGKIGTAEVVFAGLGVNFIDPKGPYDASKYAGISFSRRWARVRPTRCA